MQIAQTEHAGVGPTTDRKSDLGEWTAPPPPHLDPYKIERTLAVLGMAAEDAELMRLYEKWREQFATALAVDTDDAWQATYETEDQIKDTPARTPLGVLVKLCIWWRYEQGPGDVISSALVISAMEGAATMIGNAAAAKPATIAAE